jgi:hypothetical protein
VFLAACVPAFAQWLNYPTPGIPRLPNGKPNLEAPAPKTAHGRPDLSGLYDIDNGRLFQDIAADIWPEDFPIQRWAAAFAKQREQDMRKDDPYSHCLPPGVPGINSGNRPFKILQTAGLIAILYETGGPNCSVAACILEAPKGARNEGYVWREVIRAPLARQSDFSVLVARSQHPAGPGNRLC